MPIARYCTGGVGRPRGSGDVPVHSDEILPAPSHRKGIRMAPVTRLAVSATKADASPARPGNGNAGPVRGTIDGPAAMTICNAITEALKQSCGKGPTKVKAYNTHDEIAVVVQDMLTTLEKTLVQDGHEQLVGEARQGLIRARGQGVPRDNRAGDGTACGRMADRSQPERRPRDHADPTPAALERCFVRRAGKTRM